MFNKKKYERLSESLETSSEILYAIEQVTGQIFRYENTYKRIDAENVIEIGETITNNAAFYFWQEGERCDHEDEILAALPTAIEEGTEVFWGIEPLFAEFDGEKWIKAC